MKKTLALVLAVLMVISLAACAGTTASSTASKVETPSSTASQTESKQEETKIVYPLADGGTLSLAWAEMAAVTAGGTSWQETPFIKGLEQNTGVKLEIVHPTDFSVYFAGGQYADMIYYNWNSSYTGGAQKAISDAVIIPVEKYLAEYAPDYKAFIESNETWDKMTTSPDGHKYGFNFVRTDPVLQVSAGLIIREDWLKDLNLELPETPEELKNVLIAFRDQKGASVPFSQSYNEMISKCAGFGAISGAFGVPSSGFYLDNGKVKYGAYEDGYKDYLAYMHDLYAEGLIDKNMMTLDSATVTANLLNGISGLAAGSGGSGIGNWMTSAEKSGDTTFSLTGVSPLSAKKGETAIGGHFDNPVPGRAIAISSKCKNAELACKFLNYNYTEEGHNLWNFGIEGVSWNPVTDNELYTHEYTELAFATDGLTKSQSMYQYCCVGFGPFGQDQDYIWQNNDRPQQRNALSNWMKTDVAKYALPPLTIKMDKVDEYSQVSEEISTYVSEMSFKFIVGEKPLDEFADFQKTLKDLGVEEYIAIEQDAYDEYMSR